MSNPAFPGGLHQEDPDLSPRQREVFSAVVELHGASAHPVGAASLAKETLTGLDLVASDERYVLMVLNLGPAAVRTLALELESPLAREELAEVAAVLRERLLGRSLTEVRDRLASDPELVRKSATRMVARA